MSSSCCKQRCEQLYFQYLFATESDDREQYEKKITKNYYAVCCVSNSPSGLSQCDLIVLSDIEKVIVTPTIKFHNKNRLS